MVRQKKFGFETSQALKELLAPHFEQWKKKHGGDLDDLAALCGVSPAYLSHVRRYGRVPSVPVLILLALNFKIDGNKLFQAAEVTEPFPYAPGLQIAQPEQQNDGLLSVRFNMEGFADAIRNIVRSEVRQRSVKDLLGSRPLRIGLNSHQFWMFDSKTPPADGKYSGIFPEFCRMLGVALQKEIEISYIPFANYIEALSNGKIDLFGPTQLRPNLPVEILFTIPIYHLGVSAVFRKRETPELEALPVPKDVEALRDERYQITVLRNSTAHLICNTLLKRPDSSLIICSSDAEGIERVTLRGISRPAHLFISNSITAIESHRQTPKDLTLLFATQNTLLDLAENSIAVRPDWPEVLPVINDAIRFVHSRGGFSERLAKLGSGPYKEVMRL